MAAVLLTTIWASVLAWSAAEVLRRGGPGRATRARAVYTAGAVLMVAHTIAAFAFHGWSHDAAFAETARRTEQLTGVASGAGLYLNYLFVALWCADAAWWWIAPARYAARARAVDLAIFAFFVFMVLNGAVIFATSPMRVAGAAAVLAAVAARTIESRPWTRA